MENNEHLEGFLNILKEQHNASTKNINKSLFDDICKTAEIVEKTENEAERKEIIENLRVRFKNVDLNQVTDIFIYNQMFFTSNENPMPTPSILCVNIGKSFTEENLHYAASKVYSKDETEGGSALSFLGYLAIHHHRTYVLNFIKDNFKGFSQNKKTECVFQLKQYLDDDEIAKQIINDSGITEYKLTFSTEEDSTSVPITFKLGALKVNNNEKSNKESQNAKTDKSVNEIKSTINEEKSKSKSTWWQFWKNDK